MMTDVRISIEKMKRILTLLLSMVLLSGIIVPKVQAETPVPMTNLGIDGAIEKAELKLNSIHEEELKYSEINSYLKQRDIGSCASAVTVCTDYVNYGWEDNVWNKYYEHVDTVKKGYITKTVDGYRSYEWKNDKSVPVWVRDVTYYTRDAQGYVTEEKNYSRGTLVRTRKITYNKKHNITKRVDYDGTNTVIGQSIYEYKKGRLNTITCYAGKSKKTLKSVAIYTYTKSGDIKTVSEKDRWGKPLAEYSYTYDAKGRQIKSIFRCYLVGTLINTSITTFTYYKNGSFLYSLNCGGR